MQVRVIKVESYPMVSELEYAITVLGVGPCKPQQKVRRGQSTGQRSEQIALKKMGKYL